MRPSRIRVPFASAARRALLLLVAGLLGVGLAVTAPPQTVNAVPSGCGITFNCITITVAPFGNGSGTAVGKVLGNGINCHYANGVLTGTCAYQYKWAGTASLYVDLTFTPDAHSRLCAQSITITCYSAGVSQTETFGFSPTNHDVMDTFYGFNLLPEAVTVTRTGVGSGTVASSIQPGIACGPTCSAQFDYGTTVKLTAKPDAGAVFTAWTGACAGQKATCTLKVTKDLSTNAVFSLPGATAAPTPRPTVLPTSGPTAAPASAAPSDSLLPASPGVSGASPSPIDSGLTAVAGATPPESASTPPVQAPLPPSAETGVPVVLVVVLVLMALLIGGLAAALALVLRRGRAG